MRCINHTFIAALAALMASCAPTKFVAEGDYLLDKVSVRTDGDATGVDMGKMNALVAQKGNSRWFSALRIPLATYSLAGRDTTKWINRTLRAMGEAPVVFDTLLAKQTCASLQAELRNKGYLGAWVEVSAEKRKRRLRATYTLHPGEPYTIDHVEYIVKDTAIARLLRLDKPENQRVRAGQRFNAEALDAERKRIATMLANEGYYRFNKDFISYRADTMAGRKTVALTLTLHPYRQANGDTAEHKRYRIGTIAYAAAGADSARLPLRRAVLDNNTFIRPGEHFSADDLQKTYNHFGRLQAVRYTNIQFNERTDSPTLDCDIQLSPNKTHSISFQPEGTNTAGDLGAAMSLTYQNRNLFRGSELFSIELRGAFEAIRGLEGYSNGNFEEYSIEARLGFPRLIAPFLSAGFRKRNTATSELSLTYDLQNRPEYHRRVLAAAWRYKWGDANHHDRYQVDLLDLNYVSMPWISSTFRRDYLDDTSSRNAILRYNYEDLFIMKFGFGFTYNNGTYAIKANIETAGNLLQLTSSLFRYSRNDAGQRTLFRIAYAQYVKGDFEYTRNIRFSYNNALVVHAGLGIAYPYGNSTILPFEKRYFSGGANSVRGWSVRTLGPGSYRRADGNIDFINQTGDLKLDLNIEYRAHIFWKLDGAMFIDAGNIWTLRNYDDQPGGQFRLSTFLKQMAASYGLGLRLNFSYFVLRFDFGMKAVNPVYNTSKEHFPITNPRLSRDLAFHFAVGYPF